MVAAASKVGRVARPPNPIDTSTYSGRVAARVRELRAKKEWKIEDFWLRLRDIGLDRSMNTLRAWESGRRLIHPNDYPAIAEAFGISIHSFLPKK